MLKERGVKQLFPIQYLSFDSVYDGKDLIGQAFQSQLALASRTQTLLSLLARVWLRKTNSHRQAIGTGQAVRQVLLWNLVCETRQLP